MNAKPLLRWAGSKRKLVPLLRTYWRSDHTRYIEPFAGSACLFFALAPEKAILGDLNHELIETYLEIKYRVRPIIDELRSLGQGNKETYLRLRAADLKPLCGSERAARFIYLNRFCFNGIYRTNRAGRFNVPYGGGSSGSLPTSEFLLQFAKKLKKTVLVRGDFEDLTRRARVGDLVYLDPPYATNSRRVFTEYHPDTFIQSDIVRLRACMEDLDARGVDFLVSYGESPEANVLAKGFRVETVSVRRNVAGFAAHRKMSGEVLISNFSRK